MSANPNLATQSHQDSGIPTGAAGEELLRTEGLRKVFRSGERELTVLAGLDLVLTNGEMVAVVGASGTGKSTLLHILGALDTPTSGTVYFRRKPLETMDESRLADFRNRSVGFVWQRHHLLPDFSAAENVAMPLMMRGTLRNAAIRTARVWLGEVGLAKQGEKRAAELSGGEQQRVAIARALVARPQLLLADEPTGDLDEDNAETVFGLLQRMHRSFRLTSILATHNLLLANRADRMLRLEHGLLHPVATLATGPAQADSFTPTGAWGKRG
jgi:lipoprotein-releasing system ATP-binding protein